MNKLKKLIALGTTLSMILSFVAVLPVQAVTIADGDLVMAANSSAVYYIQGSYKRVFPHFNVYLSWGYSEDFSTVKTVSASELAAYTDANPMPFRDGSLFRGTSASLGGKDATAVFYVENSQIRPVLSETVYQGLFSDLSWAKVTWVPDDLLTKFSYELGSNVSTSSTHPDGSLVKYAGTSQIYLIKDGKKRAVSTAAFASNRYKSADVLTIQSGETYADGTSVTGVESGLLTPGWSGISTSAALSASLVSSTGTSIPGGSSNVSLLSVRFTAGSTAATISGLTVKRTGAGEYSDWDALYLFEGDKRITASARSLNSDTHEVEFPTLSISIPANSSKVVTLRGDLTTSQTAGGLHAFQLKAVDTTATVSNLPLTGPTFTNAAVDVSTVTVAASATPSNPSVGADEAEIATFKLTAGTQDIEFNQIVLTFSGSLSRGDVANLKLYQEGTLLASVASVETNDTVTFTLSSPYTITNGQNKTFGVKADLGGRVNETLTTKIEETGHVFCTDKQYGYGAAITGPNVTIGNGLTLQGSTVTLTDNGPVAGTIGKNTGDVVLTKFAITADRDIEVRKMEVNLCIDSGTDVALGSTTISDLRIKDLDTGSTLMSKAITSPTNWGAGTSATLLISEDCSDPLDYVLTDIFNLKANETRNLGVTVDLGTSSTLNGHTIRASVNVDSADVQYSATQVYMKDVTTGDYLYMADIVPTSITGDDQTIEAAAITALVSATPVTGLTVVKGATGVEGVGINLTAGDASAMNIRQMAVRVYVDTTSKLFSNEDTSPKGEVLKVTLWDETTKLSEKSLSNTTGTPDYGSATFDNLDVDITAGQTKKLVVKFDVDASASARWVAVGVPAAGFSAYDADGNSVDVSGDTNLVTVGAEPNRYVIISTAGSMTMAQDASTPDSAIVLAGTDDVVMSKVKITATQEDWTVQELTVGLDTTTNEGSIEAVKISYTDGNTTITKSGSLSNGVLKFTGLNWTIKQDTEKILTIKADLAAIDPNIATTGRELILGLDCATANNCKAVGGSSTIYGDTLNELSDADGNAMYLRKTRPTVSAAALLSTTLNNGTKILNKFDITADSAGTIALKKLSWDINVNDNTVAGAGLVITTWRLYKSGTATAIAGMWSDTTSASSTAGTVPLADGASVLVFEPTSEIEIAAGETKTFELKGNVTGSAQYDSISTSLLNDNNDTAVRTGGLADDGNECVKIDSGATNYSVDFLWSDKATGVNHLATMQDSVKDWTNGYLIEVLPTSTVSLVYPS